jgi:hypothetical protein
MHTVEEESAGRPQHPHDLNQHPVEVIHIGGGPAADGHRKRRRLEWKLLGIALNDPERTLSREAQLVSRQLNTDRRPAELLDH